MHQHQGRALYWVAEPSSTLDQLRSFRKLSPYFCRSQTPAPLDFTSPCHLAASMGASGHIGLRPNAWRCLSTNSPMCWRLIPRCCRSAPEHVGSSFEADTVVLDIVRLYLGMMQTASAVISSAIVRKSHAATAFAANPVWLHSRFLS